MRELTGAVRVARVRVRAAVSAPEVVAAVAVGRRVRVRYSATRQATSYRRGAAEERKVASTHAAEVDGNAEVVPTRHIVAIATTTTTATATRTVVGERESAGGEVVWDAVADELEGEGGVGHGVAVALVAVGAVVVVGSRVQPQLREAAAVMPLASTA